MNQTQAQLLKRIVPAPAIALIRKVMVARYRKRAHRGECLVDYFYSLSQANSQLMCGYITEEMYRLRIRDAQALLARRKKHNWHRH